MTRLLALLTTFLVALLGASGCADADASEGADVGSNEGAWGHLVLEPGAPQYLINKRAGQTWRVCVPRYMTEMLPGVTSEIAASAAIWAHYLDRNVEVRIEERTLPRAQAGQSTYDLARAYHAACGQGFDAVFGLADLQGDVMGVTAGEGMKDANGRWVSFTRFVFLRDFTLRPDAIDGVPSSWVSLEAAAQRPYRRDELLGLMKERSFTRYVEGARRLSLPVLTHEIGHVWGLCDQYEGSANCDPTNSTSHMVSESIMGASTMRERVFLTDDDIAGVRALARRPGFDAGWSPPSNTPARPIVRPDVELFRLDRIARTGGELSLVFGLVTTRAMQVEIGYRVAGSGAAFKKFAPMVSPEAFDAPRLAVRMPVDRESAAQKLEVRVTLSLKTASGSFAPVQTLSLSE